MMQKELPSLGIPLENQQSPDWVDFSDQHEKLWELLQKKNGYEFFHSAMIFFPSIRSTTSWPTIEDLLNHMEESDFLSDHHYLVPFACDAFGFLFFVGFDGIYHMESEDGSLEYVAENLEGFFSLLMDEEGGDYWSASPIFEQWCEENAPLKAPMRLTAQQPFLLGGEFETENLLKGDLLAVLQWYADLHRLFKDVEDGQEVEIQRTFQGKLS